MLRLDKAGYTPQFHVHDEVIVEVDQDSAETDMERIRDIMRLKDVDWLKGLPLNAEGYLTTSAYVVINSTSSQKSVGAKSASSVIKLRD